ncbi:MAG: VOC family protein [Acidimicrobiia bacterium]
MSGASVRYFVDDLDRAIEFYIANLDFEVMVRPSPGFAILKRGDLRLLLNEPGVPGGAGESMPDGSLPAPGGSNRFQIEVEDLETIVRPLREMGVSLQDGVSLGIGGKHILLEDPAGNRIELFEPWSNHSHSAEQHPHPDPIGLRRAGEGT